MKNNNDYNRIKNLFFDLDNTIIMDTDEDVEYYRDALKKLGYDENEYYNIFNVIDEYETTISEKDSYYNKEKLLIYLNNKLNSNYSMKLIDEINDIIGKYWIKKILLKEDTLKYLSQKYNLYIFTNYFQEAQTERIKNINYDKYFKKIFGADNYGCKPYKKSFLKILKEIDAKEEECVMIGDTKSKDILAANNVGMKSILVDYDGKRDKKDVIAENYLVINEINNLVEIL